MDKIIESLYIKEEFNKMKYFTDYQKYYGDLIQDIIKLKEKIPYNLTNVFDEILCFNTKAYENLKKEIYDIGFKAGFTFVIDNYINKK